MDTFASRRRTLLDALQEAQTGRGPAFPSQMGGRPPYSVGGVPSWAGMLEPRLTPPAARPPITVLNERGTAGGYPGPDMTSARPYSFSGQPDPWAYSGGYPAQDMPAPAAAYAGPAQTPPMPPPRPQPGPQMQLASAAQGDPMAAIRGYNPQAAQGNPQAVADQYGGGDLAKLAARTYREDDGSTWNDYYLR